MLDNNMASCTLPAAGDYNQIQNINYSESKLFFIELLCVCYQLVRCHFSTKCLIHLENEITKLCSLLAI
jgi:hypothetical protein